MKRAIVILEKFLNNKPYYCTANRGNKMRSNTIVLVAATVILFSGITFSQDKGSVADSTLLGLEAIMIEVIPFDKRTEKNCVTSTAIEKELELKLRLAGLKIYSSPTLSEEEKWEWFDFGAPILHVKVMAVYGDFEDSDLGDFSMGAFHINLSLFEVATFDREPNNRGPAKRWETQELVSLGQGKYSTLRGDISELIDEFIIDYLKVNPK